MEQKINQSSKKGIRIFYDVDTQKDFMDKNGSLYVPDAEFIKPNLRLLTNYAEQNLIPILGSLDRHYGTEEFKPREGELARWGGPFPDHCMAGTKGEEKIDETTTFGMYPNKGGKWPAQLILSNPLVQNSNYIDSELNEALKEINEIPNHDTQNGIYFAKQSYDVFTNPFFEQFLKESKVTESLVYGVATDYCVKAAVLGMQRSGIQTYVVEDAIKGITPLGEKSALEEMAKAGARFVKTNDVLEGKLW